MVIAIGGADVYIAKIAEAQTKLGTPIDRDEWLRTRPKPLHGDD